MSTLCLIASIMCGWNAWLIFRPGSAQGALVERWSTLAIVLWWVMAVLGLLVYYPLPYFNHHIDRFLLALVVVLLWGAWLLASPASLGRVLASRPFHWLRVVLINAVLFLVLGEVVMRVSDPILARSGLFSGTADTPGGGIPGQITDSSGMRTNSRGFRDRERTIARASTAVRTVAIGDSFTWASGVRYDESFITLVERGLHRANVESEVINVGQVGYQPEDYLSLLKSHALAYQPDLVLLNFFIGNDLMPAQGAQIVVAGHRHRVHINGNWFHDHLSWDHWYLSHDLHYAWILMTERVRLAMGMSAFGMFSTGQGQSDAGESSVSFPGWSARYVRMIQGMGDQFLKRDTPAFLARWNETKGILEQFNGVLQERGIPWVLVLLPAEEQVDEGLKQLYIAMRGGMPEQYDFDKPQRLLQEWGGERGVKIIDFTPQFRANVVHQRLYVDNDIHWNRNGHALAAQILIQELLREVPENEKGLKTSGTE